MADLRQQPVADLLAERVVQDLEAVEVEEEDRVTGLRAPGTREALLETIDEESPVGQLRQRVVERSVPQLRLGFLAAADVRQ